MSFLLLISIFSFDFSSVFILLYLTWSLAWCLSLETLFLSFLRTISGVDFVSRFRFPFLFFLFSDLWLAYTVSGWLVGTSIGR
jgi:hypothetical protein